jgi:hypothetical protein
LFLRSILAVGKEGAKGYFHTSEKRFFIQRGRNLAEFWAGSWL